MLLGVWEQGMATPPLLWGPSLRELRTLGELPGLPFHLPSGVRSATILFQLSHSPSHATFSLPDEPSNPRAGLFPLPPCTSRSHRDPEQVTEPGVAHTEGRPQARLPLASRIPAWTPGTDQP